MTDPYQIQASSESENDQIHQMLRSYNRQFMRELKDYSFHIRQDGQIVAGIVAGSVFDTLEVEFLFVAENRRGNGLGHLLLRHVEELARRDGLKRISLNTYSYQAPEFYRKAGYRQTAKIDPCFASFSQFFFEKEL